MSWGQTAGQVFELTFHFQESVSLCVLLRTGEIWKHFDCCSLIPPAPQLQVGKSRQNVQVTTHLKQEILSFEVWKMIGIFWCRESRAELRF